MKQASSMIREATYLLITLPLVSGLMAAALLVSLK